MTAKADRDARRAQGLLLAVVLVVSQASAWFHATAVTHVACLEHGEAVHGAALPAREVAAVDVEAAPVVRADLAGVGGHDHCANAALLRWRDVALSTPSTLAPLTPAPRPMPFVVSSDAPRGAVVYLIAPKTSPPPASA
jgi:hypothetical protein